MSSTLEMPPVMAQQKGWIDFPPAPERISDLGIAEDLANDLALKLASTVPQFDTKWGAERLQIPIQLAEKLFWKLKQDRWSSPHGLSHSYIFAIKKSRPQLE